MTRTVVLSGGTGSAKLLRGLQRLAPRFTVIANVGDNAWFHGLYVCPDVDTATYSMAGMSEPAHGWGIAGDTFGALQALERLGADGTWFRIGDADLATCLYRTAMLRGGRTLTEATAAISRALGVKGCAILPASDRHVETRITTVEKGELHLQEFWVREKGLLTPRRVRYAGAARSRATPEVRRALASADRIILAPGNPMTSILPILATPGIRGALAKSGATRVAVSPMVGNASFSGPAARLMAASGLSPSSAGVALAYKGVIDVLILDESDRPRQKEVEKAGASCLFSSTLMKSREDETRVARLAMEAR